MRTVIVHFKHSAYFYIGLTNKPVDDRLSIGKSIQLSDLAEYLGDELEYNFLKDDSSRQDLINEFINDSKCLNNKNNIPKGDFDVVEQSLNGKNRIVIKKGDQYILAAGLKPVEDVTGVSERILSNHYLYESAVSKARSIVNKKIQSIKYLERINR